MRCSWCPQEIPWENQGAHQGAPPWCGQCEIPYDEAAAAAEASAWGATLPLTCAACAKTLLRSDEMIAVETHLYCHQCFSYWFNQCERCAKTIHERETCSKAGRLFCGACDAHLLGQNTHHVPEASKDRCTAHDGLFRLHAPGP